MDQNQIESNRNVGCAMVQYGPILIIWIIWGVHWFNAFNPRMVSALWSWFGLRPFWFTFVYQSLPRPHETKHISLKWSKNCPGIAEKMGQKTEVPQSQVGGSRGRSDFGVGKARHTSTMQHLLQVFVTTSIAGPMVFKFMANVWLLVRPIHPNRI